MPARKREAPLTPEPSGRRRSSRISLSGQTSKYFEGDDSEDDEDSHRGKRAKTSSAAKSRNGARRTMDDSGDSDGDAYQEDEDEEDEDGDEEAAEEEGEEKDTQNMKNAKGKGKKNGHVDSDDSDDDDESGPRRTFVPHKKLRDLGGVDYSDDTVHPVTMLFLKDLKANNRREWLKGNDAEFRRAQKDWLSYVESVGARMAADADDTLPELPAKDVVFRIYRDIRFSKNPQPYKPHFSAAWSRTGKKGPYACYYMHCEPGNCFIGGGLWYPDNDQLRLLRASIDERPQRWRRALVEDTRLRETFFPEGVQKHKGRSGKGKAAKNAENKKGGEDADEAAAKKAFAKLNAENALKKKPLGYSADHRDIELLKLRNFFAHKKLPDSTFTDPDGHDKMIEIVQALVPFVTHLNRIVRPDPGDESDSEDESDEDEGEEAGEEEDEGEDKNGDEDEGEDED
ncbi:hypothetical protein SCUCBS95973_008736 [Sporothrix curviconia]|uniref:Uncharacterized protein n=1 Tax=Sporothrix curviconia TaxID=1260050 RepID=A0ABP0CPV8_9PEZI